MMRAAVVLLFFSTVGLMAQEPAWKAERRKALLEGTQVLRRILHDDQFTALESLDDLKTEPSKTLLIVLGDLDILGRLPGGLEEFLASGGAALLASDRAITDRDARAVLRRTTGASISADSIVVDRDGFQGHQFCPFLVRWPGSQPNLFQDATGNAVKPIATNVPAMLTIHNSVRGINLLAVLPNGSRLESRIRSMPIDGWPSFAIGGQSGTGRLLLLADHSVFINEMMMPQETGNVEFAANCIRYLQAGEAWQAGRVNAPVALEPKAKRDRVLFLEEGKILTQLSIPLKSPRLTPEEMLSLLYARRNNLLIETESWLAKQEDDDNAIQRKLMNFMEQSEKDWTRILYGIVITATLAALLFVAYRLGVGDRYGTDRVSPPLVTVASKSLPLGPLAEQRVAALLLAHDVREPLMNLARRWFADLGIAPPRSSSSPCPSIHAVGWWSGHRLRWRLRRVWRLAAAAWPGPIAPHMLEYWQREMDDLRTATNRNQWHTSEKPKPEAGNSGR